MPSLGYVAGVLKLARGGVLGTARGGFVPDFPGAAVGSPPGPVLAPSIAPSLAHAAFFRAASVARRRCSKCHYTPFSPMLPRP